ncbi:MAG: 4-aminobutyrate--2-oxoglutarate transaminase [Gemmatimonadota bacterium]
MGPNEALLARRTAVVARGVPMVTTATVASATGARLRDAEGAELIDFAGGIGVMNVGHGHPRVVAAIKAQADRLLHTCFHIATYEPYVALCERLAALLPHGDSTKVLLLNSGAEAVENAVKIARQATGRPAVLCFTEGFHGRTLLGMSLTSKVGYKVGCGPFAPEIYRLPFPNHYRYGDGLDLDTFVERAIQRLRDAFHNLVAAQDLAAVLLEPIQGEGGFVPAPAAWLRALRELCDEHGIVLIFDEVQSGFCRTGHWGVYQHYGVTPDISTWAKSLGGGLPISAVVGKAAVMDAAAPGTLGGTYGGNPVACAAALAAIDAMEELDLNRRAKAVGERVRSRFVALQARCPAIGDVRGIGAMIGVEFVEEGDPARPAGAFVKEVLGAALQRGVLSIAAGTHGNIIRVLSPLVISNEDLEHGLDILEEEVLAAWSRHEAAPARMQA